MIKSSLRVLSIAAITACTALPLLAWPRVLRAEPKENQAIAECDEVDCSSAEPAPPSGPRQNWISVALDQDFLFLPGATNACSGGTPYDCFRDDETHYDGIPYAKSGGGIRGGIAAATTRLLIGYDRSFFNLTAGVRVGFAFGGGPQAPGGNAFLPIHAEGRLSYWFGRDPFGRAGVRPYVTAFGGFAQVDSNVSVSVYETESDFIADRRLSLDAWKKAGTGFVAVGAGVLYAITPRTGPYVELRGMQLFGLSGTGMGLRLGYAFGF